jgi:phenylpyruvate tautomerase PptA (4-oxalocrotonate tautomerase family)
VPIVRIDLQSGKSTAYKRSILHGVRSAITSTLGVPDERVMQRIIETPSEDIDLAEVRTDRLTIVEISMLTGRGIELKEALYIAIAERLLEDPGITRHDLVVLVNEGAGECFFLNGQMSCAPVEPPHAESEQS